MARIRISKEVKCFLICFLIGFILLGIVLYKPPLRTITASELDAIHGIKQGGVVMETIQAYLIENPDAKVEDLRRLKRIDDMIIDQLKERFR